MNTVQESSFFIESAEAKEKLMGINRKIEGLGSVSVGDIRGDVNFKLGRGDSPQDLARSYERNQPPEYLQVLKDYYPSVYQFTDQYAAEQKAKEDIANFQPLSKQKSHLTLPPGGMPLSAYGVMYDGMEGDGEQQIGLVPIVLGGLLGWFMYTLIKRSLK